MQHGYSGHDGCVAVSGSPCCEVSNHAHCPGTHTPGCHAGQKLKALVAKSLSKGQRAKPPAPKKPAKAKAVKKGKKKGKKN
jgi:hypothetical protein